ncbi:MAG: glycosyltransferase family 4 protein [Negativicutes bacterium]|jgi:glycosyltransferase involved in cell wall biosynthesis
MQKNVNQPLSVALMIGTNIWTGAEQHVYNQACGLRDAGCSVVIIVRRNTVPYERFRNEFKTYALPFINAFDLITVAAIVWIIVKEKLNIIHTHHNKVSWLAVFASLLFSRVRVLNTIHMVQWHGKSSRVRLWLYGRLAAIVCPSETVRRSFVHFNPLVGEKKVVTVYNGIDIDGLKNYTGIFLRDELGIAPETLLFGSVGRISPDKGTDILLDAFALAQPLAASLVLVGADEGEFGVEMRAKVATLGLTDKVFFYGATKDIAKIMNGIDVLVQPSRLRESFGQVLCEAMVCGKPVIATQNGAQSEIVTDGEAGFLVELNADDIAERMLLLAQDRIMAQKMGVLAKVKVEEYFSIRAMCEKMVNLYRMVL